MILVSKQVFILIRRKQNLVITAKLMSSFMTLILCSSDLDLLSQKSLASAKSKGKILR